jgi:hypothetical protein
VKPGTLNMPTYWDLMWGPSAFLVRALGVMRPAQFIPYLPGLRTGVEKASGRRLGWWGGMGPQGVAGWRGAEVLLCGVGGLVLLFGGGGVGRE